MDYLSIISSLISTIMTFKLLCFLNKFNYYNEIHYENNNNNDEKIENKEISNDVLYAISTHLKSIKRLLEIYNKLEPEIDIEQLKNNNIGMISNVNKIIEEQDIDFGESDIEIKSNSSSDTEHENSDTEIVCPN